MNSLFFEYILVIIMSLLVVACSHMKRHECDQKLSQMSDSEVIRYYRGINDRLKELKQRYDIEREHGAPFKYDRLQSQVIGGEIHILEKNRRCIRAELLRRYIEP